MRTKRPNDLSQLSPSSFEHLVSALALEVLGAGATGFGPGPDSGRDAWFEGEARYPSPAERWRGVWCIQCKFHAPHLSKNAQQWLLTQIRDEITRFSSAREHGGSRQWPDVWIVATNIDPSAAKNGTFDKARALVSKAHPTLAKRFHIWGGRKVRDFLAKYPHIARRYGQFLTPGDVLARLYDALDDEKASADDIVRCLVVDGIQEQQHTRLEQAGSRDDKRPGIERLFVDLPFASPVAGAGVAALANLTKAGSRPQSFDQREWTDDRASKWWRRSPARAGVWFVRAGPGRGKSSIGQFYCQIQRAALLLLRRGERVHPDVRAIAEQVRTRAKELNAWPSVPRVPIWVELKSYARWYAQQGPNEPRGVVPYVCSLVRKVVAANVPAKTLRRALQEGCWSVVFDGLDEVPADVRDGVASEVVRFVRETTADGDLLAICTSRPQGYAGQFDSLSGAVVDLVDLPAAVALECAKKVVEIDRTPSECRKGEATLKRALQSGAVRELMTTPLQAHIMAVLVRNGQRPPERKWDLYHKFYHVIREREASRDLAEPLLRDLLQGDSPIIDEVHRQLGFLLHASAERSAGAEASLSRPQFRRLVEQVVREYMDESDVPRVSSSVIAAATDRLVLINTPDQGDRVRFDVRAIQEFFAAEFMYYEVAADELRQRLEVVSGDVHWREVVQFVLGALVASGRMTERTVALDVLRQLDAGHEDGHERALCQRVGRGSLHATLAFQNGVPEGNRRLREDFRPSLDPVAATTDTSRIVALAQAPTVELRNWIWEWATSQLRSKIESNTCGATRICAELCLRAESTAEAAATLTSLPTAILARITDHWWKAMRGAYDQDARAMSIGAAREELLRRSDVFIQAPGELAAILYRLLSVPRRYSFEERGEMRGLEQLPITGELVRVSQELHETEVSGASFFSIDAAGKWTGYARRWLDHSHNSPAVLTWLGQIWDYSEHRGATRLARILERLGNDWRPLEAVPADLRMRIPIPVDAAAVPPSDLADRVVGLSDADLARCIDERNVGGCEIESPQQRLWRWSAQSLDDKGFTSILNSHPSSAWALWCYSAADAPQNRASFERHVPALLHTLQQHPHLLTRVPPLALMWGIDAFGEHAEDIRDLIRHLGVHWNLTSRSWAHGGLPTRTIDATKDSALLVPLTSAIIATIDHEIAFRTQERSTADAFAYTAAMCATPRQLEAIAEDGGLDQEVRSAAMILSGIHPKGGPSSLLRWSEELLVRSQSGAWPCAMVARVIELHGAWHVRECRALLSSLIEASSVAVSSCVDDWDTLDNTLRRWRETSDAPVSSHGLAQRWLRDPEAVVEVP